MARPVRSPPTPNPFVFALFLANLCTGGARNVYRYENKAQKSWGKIKKDVTGETKITQVLDAVRKRDAALKVSVGRTRPPAVPSIFPALPPAGWGTPFVCREKRPARCQLSRWLSCPAQLPSVCLCVCVGGGGS